MRARTVLRILLAVVFFSTASAAAFAAEGKKSLSVLAGTFPMYLFTQNLTRGVESVKVDVMIPPGLGCPHDYALTPADMNKIGKSDIFVANGLGLEGFLGAPLKRANPKIVLIDSSAGVTGLKGMTPEPSDKGHGEHHHEQMNPHLFASPRMAAKVVRSIAEGLAKADPVNAGAYRANGESYAAGLDRLADELASMGAGLKSKRIVTEHAVFDYLAADIGLDVVAVVEEVPGQEPSASEMLRIVREVKESGAAAVFTEPQYPAKVGKTIAREASVPVAVLDPVATGPDNAPLDYYEKTMRENMETLKRTLGHAGS